MFQNQKNTEFDEFRCIRAEHIIGGTSTLGHTLNSLETSMPEVAWSVFLAHKFYDLTSYGFSLA